MYKLKVIYLILSIGCCALLRSQEYNIVANVTRGCEQLDVTFSLSTTSGVVSAAWDFGNGQTFSGLVPPVISYDTLGVYDVSVVINGIETISRPGFIAVFPEPVTNFRTDGMFDGSFNVFMEAVAQPAPYDTVSYLYAWDYGNGLTFSTYSRQNAHHYTTEGNYTITLTVSDAYGCSASSSRGVTVTSRFEVPNVFTPNNDGYHDKLIVQTDGESVYSMQIFSRYGTLVYKTESPVIMWDGLNSNGTKVAPGIYYYVIEEINGLGRSQTGFVYVFY